MLYPIAGINGTLEVLKKCISCLPRIKKNIVKMIIIETKLQNKSYLIIFYRVISAGAMHTYEHTGQWIMKCPVLTPKECARV